MRKPVDTKQFTLDQALPWDVYDAGGRRVFRRGFVFRNQASLARVKNMVLFCEQPDQPAQSAAGEDQALNNASSVRSRQVIYEFNEDRATMLQQVNGSVFSFLDYCVATEKRICESISEGASDQLPALAALCEDVISVYSQATDACLAAVHVDYEHPLVSMQPVYSALLALLVAEGLGLSVKQPRSLVAAALTADLGLFRHFEFLMNRSLPLDDEEKAYLRSHPRRSYDLLCINHVTDETWLKAVLQHHERIDGSGYPDGVKEDDICELARILGVVDTYVEMLLPRVNRKSLPPKIAMQEIYKPAAAAGDTVAIALIKQLGVYPPGSLVRLANQEIAVVLERNKQTSVAPKVAAIGVLPSQQYNQHIVRHTNTPNYRIVDVYKPETPVSFDMNQLWLDKFRPPDT